MYNLVMMGILKCCQIQHSHKHHSCWKNHGWKEHNNGVRLSADGEFLGRQHRAVWQLYEHIDINKDNG